jgi:hypothetical protein
MSTRDELVAAIVERYGRSNRAERSQILNEFVAVTGFHRKHAARCLAADSRVGGLGHAGAAEYTMMRFARR